MMTPLDTLVAARQLLLDRGWTQHEWASFGGLGVFYDSPEVDAFCATGAIYRAIYAATGNPDAPCKGEGYGLVRLCCGMLLHWPNRPLIDLSEMIDWNDHPNRTYHEVLARFTQVIDGLQERDAKGDASG